MTSLRVALKLSMADVKPDTGRKKNKAQLSALPPEDNLFALPLPGKSCVVQPFQKNQSNKLYFSS